MSPVLTLEVLTEPDSTMNSSYLASNPTIILDSSSGVHFLTDIQAASLFSPKVEHKQDDHEEMGFSTAKSKSELLEYLIKSDGSVICKRCGEVLQSRTHWYRHKYKFHVVSAANPSTLFKCEECGVFFKSRKGYIGHIASRHSEYNERKEETQCINLQNTTIKQEPVDAELAIPKCELPNINYIDPKRKEKSNHQNENLIKTESKKGVNLETIEDVNNPNWKKRRMQEERLVADIIARVKKECEAAGVAGGTRKGYTRRSTLTNV